MSDPRDEVAAVFKEAAEKLDRAAAHCRIAALHYENGEVPRGCASLMWGTQLMPARVVGSEGAT